MPTIIVKVDLECCRCHAKIHKVLTRIQEKGEFRVDDVEYDKSSNRVVVSGPFDAEKLADKLCCKACSIIKEIEIVEPPPKTKPNKELEQPPVKKQKPKPPPPPGQDVAAPPAPPPAKVKPAPPEPPKDAEPAPKRNKFVEVPYPWPYPVPAWPPSGCCCCHHGCCSCGKQAPEPPPPQYIPVPQPYPACCRIVCEEDPSYACTIM